MPVCYNYGELKFTDDGGSIVRSIPLDEDWRFLLGNTGMWGGVPDVTDDWRSIHLPHDWSIEHSPDESNPSACSGGFLPGGTGWYSKEFLASADWAAGTVAVEFEGVYQNAEVWLNGNFLYRHPYGYTSFIVPLNPHLRIGEVNRLAVRVDNSCHPNCRWYSGSGIYRHVRLLVGDVIHIKPHSIFVTTPVISQKSAVVEVELQINESSILRGSHLRRGLHLRVSIDSSSASEGRVATALCDVEPGEFRYRIVLSVDNPRLWSPDSPFLYTLVCELISDGVVTDEEHVRFGIRSISFDADKGFSLNGKSMKLKGGCVHHDHGPLGAAAFDRAEERKVRLLKESGFNAVRCAHNPPSPAFLDACDRIGLLVIDEAFDCWRLGKLPYDYHVYFADWWERDLESMITRDRNHPSVIMWSIGNELGERDGKSDGFKIAEELALHSRAIDPTRPVTAGLCGGQFDWAETAQVFSVLGVCGYNYQEQSYRADHDCYPRRVMVGSESMPWFAHKNWASVMELPYVIGDFVWTAFDYLGEAGLGAVRYEGEEMKWTGGWPWVQAFCGDIDICGWKRPQSYYRDMLWSDKPGLWMGVKVPGLEGKTEVYNWWSWPDVVDGWNWAGHEGRELTVFIYSSCETVELFVNGHSVGERPAGKANSYTAEYLVKYEPGELRAVGRNSDGTNIDRATRTAGPAASLRLKPDRDIVDKAIGDLCYIDVEVIDSEGNLVHDSDAEVSFAVTGPAALHAVGSNNPRSTEPYQGTPDSPVNSRRAYRGKCLAILRSTGESGEIKLQANSPGLVSGEVVVTACGSSE